jgi:hypothetical protein
VEGIAGLFETSLRLSNVPARWSENGQFGGVGQATQRQKKAQAQQEDDTTDADSDRQFYFKAEKALLLQRIDAASYPTARVRWLSVDPHIMTIADDVRRIGSDFGSNTKSRYLECWARSNPKAA